MIRPPLRGPLAAVLAAGMVACSSPEERFARRVAHAEQLLREDRGDEALLELYSALEIDPRSAEVNQRIGELLARQGATARAVAHLGEAYQLDPGRFRAALEQATLLSATQPERAKRIVERVKQAHADAPAVYRSEAALALAGGDTAGARTALDRALALAAEQHDGPERRRAALELERVARRTGDEPLVRAALRQQIDAAPDRLASWERLAALDGEPIWQELIASQSGSAEAHILFSAHLAERGRGDEAIAHLERVIANGLDAPLLWEQMVRLELAERRAAAARAHQQELEERHRGDPATRRSAARLALAEGRADEAGQLLKALEGERADAESEALRAQIALERGDLEAAKAAAQRAAELARGFSASAERLRAAVHAAAREWPEALAALERIRVRGLALTADDALVRARALYALGQRPDAKGELVALLDRPEAPPDAAVLFAREEGTSDPARARAELERAHERAPAHYAVLEALTRDDLRDGDPARALARLERVIGTQRTGPRVLLLRAEALASAGQLARAEADALRALESAPDLPRAVDVAYAIFAAQGKLDAALQSFEEAEAAGALHGGARALLARLHLARGDADRALAIYERVVVEDPEIAPAKNDLAFMLASRGVELERALELARDAERALPDNANASDTLGFVLLQLGRPEQALAPLRAAVERAAPGDPSLPTFLHHLGLALTALERDEDAAAQFERALAIDPAFPAAADARARLARRTN
jgi:tetratricopeptide (TPR) repeat protein